MATTTLRRTVGSSCKDADCRNTEDPANADGDAIHEPELFLLFLGCEALPPYGPYDHTAGLFLDLIAHAVSTTLPPNHRRTIAIDVYAVSRDPAGAEEPPARFPSDDDLTRCDGVILPGSFSSAYEEDQSWILALKDWIQARLVVRSVPTLGVCFGHQLYAHSFSDTPNPDPQETTNSCKEHMGGGRAVKCPAGAQAGRRTTALTPTGKAFLAAASDPAPSGDIDSREHGIINLSDDADSGLDLFYTHGDMVESLPARGVSLGGNDTVPIQAAVYFSAPVTNPEDALRKILYATESHETRSAPEVIAVTFQAHPEFAELGKGSNGDDTLHRTMRLMKDKGYLSEQDFLSAESDACRTATLVREQSLNAMMSAGRLLGWFYRTPGSI
eukprot:jgi/Psemu1/297915/fgenesh1_pm.406_\